MNTAERIERRKLRYSVIKQIEDIEANNCLVCPQRISTDASYCKDCPIPARLNELGKKLISITVREPQEKIIDVPAPKYKKSNDLLNKMRRERKKLGYPKKNIPKVKPPSAPKRQKGDPPIIFTADDFIRAIAGGEYKSEIARRIGMPDSTLYHRTLKWELTGLTRAEAIKMLRDRESVQ